MDIKLSSRLSLYLKENKQSICNSTRNASFSPTKRSSNLTCFPSQSGIRNRWTDTNNLGENHELNGSISRKYSKEFKKSTKGKWGHLLNKSVETADAAIKRAEKRDLDEMNTSRTVTHSLNGSFECGFGLGEKAGKRKHYPEVSKSLATGSIHSFMSMIPVVKTDKTRKIYTNSSQPHTDVFSKNFRMQSTTTRKLKIPVNLNKIRNDSKCAGAPSAMKSNTNRYSYNYSMNGLSTTRKPHKQSTSTQVKPKSSRKVDYKANTSTLFKTTSTEATIKSHPNHNTKKTYYDKAEYKKFFTKNFNN